MLTVVTFQAKVCRKSNTAQNWKLQACDDMHCGSLLKNAMLKQHLTAANIKTGNYHSTSKIAPTTYAHKAGFHLALLSRVTTTAAPAANTGTTKDRTLLTGRSDLTFLGLR